MKSTLSLLNCYHVALACILLGCSRVEDKPRHSRPVSTPIGAQAVVPVDSAVAAAVNRYFATRLYASWSPSAEATPEVCRSLLDDGIELQAAWGIAHARTLASAATDSLQRSADVEVHRVVSVEGDSTTSDGAYARADHVVVGVVIDTVEVELRRAGGDDWTVCAPLFARSYDTRSPIALIGPPANPAAPRGPPVTGFQPPGASWEKARALADSVARVIAPGPHQAP